MGAKKLSSAEKAAVVLLALGEETAAEIVANLSQEEVRRIGGALSRLGRVEQDVVDEVVSEFHDQIAGPNPARFLGNSDSARRLMAKALGGDPAVMGQMFDFATPALVETLASVEPKALADYLKTEHPQTIALILAHVQPRAAGETLKLLPQAMHTEVIQRLAKLGPVDPEALSELEETLKRELAQRRSRARPAVGGVDKAAALVAGLDRASGEKLLEELENTNPELAAAVREKLFTFGDLVKLDDRGMQELLKHVKPETLKYALKQAPEAVRVLIFKNMSQRAAANVQDDMAAMGKVRVTDVETAQALIASIARRLADEGKLEIQRGDEVYV